MQLRPKDNNKLKGQCELLFFCAQAKIWACEAKKQGAEADFEDVKQKMRQICKKQ